jgi:hypothetical protein
MTPSTRSTTCPERVQSQLRSGHRCAAWISTEIPLPHIHRTNPQLLSKNLEGILRFMSKAVNFDSEHRQNSDIGTLLYHEFI